MSKPAQAARASIHGDLSSSASQVIVRPATPDDVTAVSRLLAGAFAEKLIPILGSVRSAARLMEDIWRDKIGEGVQVLVAERRGELVGAIVLRPAGEASAEWQRALWRSLRHHIPWWRWPPALLGLSLMDYSPNPGEVYIDALAVSPPYRGHGVGSELLQAAIAWARDHTLDHVALHVSIHNGDARRLYQHHDFSVRSWHFSLLGGLLIGHWGFALMSVALRPA